MNKVINLSLGEPNENLPKKLLKQVSKNIENIKMGYTESIGIIELKKLISKHYKLRYRTNISDSNIAITSGASAGLFLTIMALFDQGDIIATTSPGYPCYNNILKSLLV